MLLNLLDCFIDFVLPSTGDKNEGVILYAAYAAVFASDDNFSLK
jgi:hypothetical protein